MIKTSTGTIEIEGSRAELCADLSVIIYVLVTRGILTMSDVTRTVRLAELQLKDDKKQDQNSASSDEGHDSGIDPLVNEIICQVSKIIARSLVEDPDDEKDKSEKE